MGKGHVLRSWLVGLIAVCTSLASAHADSSRPLADLELQELLELQVVSAEKHEASLGTTPASVTVLTNEDLRRAGVRTLPDALRLVPGVQVAQLTGNSWAVTARGFNGRFANKLLVMIDGRSIYTPLFSGVFWESQDTLIEDIERIEVVRGPGGALWGANAVNGVVHVITKNAAETSGTLVVAGTGSEERYEAAVRHGGRLGESASYRAWVKAFDRRRLVTLDGDEARDAHETLRVGFRVDGETGRGARYTLDAGLFDGRGEQRIDVPTLDPPSMPIATDEFDVSGGHVHGRVDDFVEWADGSSAQLFFDRSERDEDRATLELDTLDLDLLFEHELRGGHRLSWGGGYRTYIDEVRGGPIIRLDPASRTFDVASAFGHFEARLADRATMTLGAKLERNDFTGYEFQPSLRGLFEVSSRTSVWAAVSRAIAEPARIYSDVFVSAGVVVDPDSGLPVKIEVFGNPDTDSEELLAWEAGIRTCPTDAFCLDASAFYNEYEKLLVPVPDDLEIVMDPSLVFARLPVVFQSRREEEVKGAELDVRLNVAPDLEVRAWFSWIDFPAFEEPDDVTFLLGGTSFEGRTPEWQGFAGLSWTPTPRVEVDARVYAVDELPAIPDSEYVRVDLRLGVDLREGLEIELLARDAFGSDRQEFDGFLNYPSKMEPDISGRLRWSF